MAIKRMWAFWRRLQYGTGFSLIVLLLGVFVYNTYIYTPPSCFDGNQNGDERAVDCGGACVRICAMDTATPLVKWARSFRVTEGQYNAVAYIENMNKNAGTPGVAYTFSLYDAEGLITERSGTTVLPPDSVYPVFEGRIDVGSRIPTRTFLELAKVDLWLPISSGREQFNLISRELLSADTRPKLKAVLENTALTSTGEVEVVATIFDARGNALTSSRTVVDSFEPRAKENVVFTWPEPIAKTVRSCEVPTDMVLAIDLSGSMNNDQDNPPEPITSVILAAESFVNSLNPSDGVGLVTFATEAIINHNLSDSVTVAKSIQELIIDEGEERGSTNTGDAFVRAGEIFAQPTHNENARKVLVILTDGLATAPDVEPDAYALEKAQILKQSNVEVYSIGLGNEVNMEFVKALATDEAHAFQALTRDQVDRIYKQITGAVCEDGAAIIEIIPKVRANFTPLR